MIRIFMFMTALTLLPAAAMAAGFTEDQRAEIKEIVKEAIMENPQTLIDSVEAYGLKQQEQEQAKQGEKIQDFVKNLPEDIASFSTGNPKGDVHIIEFFDYNCGFCKKAFPQVQKMLKDDKNIYFTFFEMPILGPSSQEAAQWAVMAAHQGKYFEFHQAVMDFKGQLTTETLEKIAKDVGLDVKKAKNNKDKMDVQEYLANNKKLAADLGFTGTPGFLINDKDVHGYLDYDQMLKIIDTVREENKEK